MKATTPVYIKDNVFVELGLANLPDDQKIKLLEQMNDLVHQRTMLKVAETLSGEAKEALDKVDGKSEEDQLNTLLEHVPNLADLLLEEVDLVKLEIKESLAEVQE